jgi:hypothetical protein
VQAAGRIDEDNICIATLGGRHRVEYDGARVGALLVRDDIRADDLAPGLELFDGGGAKRVRGGDDDFLAVFAVRLCQLGNAGGLAGAVDADDQYACRTVVRRRLLLAPDATLLFAGLEDVDERLLEDVADSLRLLDAILFDAQLQFAEDLLRRRDAGVSADQQFFEVVPDFVVDLAAVEQA